MWVEIVFLYSYLNRGTCRRWNTSLYGNFTQKDPIIMENVKGFVKNFGCVSVLYKKFVMPIKQPKKYVEFQSE